MHIKKLNPKENVNVDLIKKEIDKAPIFKSIFDLLPVALNIWSADMVNILCNKYVLDIFGIESEQEYIDDFHKFSPEFQPNGISSQQMSQMNFKKAIDDGLHVFNWMHQTLDGEPVPSEITLIRLDAYEGNTFLVGFVRDLRSFFTQISSISRDYDYYFTDSVPSSILLNDISALSSECFFSIDLRTCKMRQYMQFSPFGDATYFTVQEILNSEKVHKDDLEALKSTVDGFKSGVFEPCDIRFLNANNEYRYNRIVGKIINDKDGKAIFVIGKIIDVHEQALLFERSRKDLLTNCFNKVSAQSIITKKIEAMPSDTHALFIVDIDNFKAINDNLGHFIGDEVLKEIADGLHNVFGSSDTIARIGGDEFIVFSQSVSDTSELGKKAEKIVEIFNRTYFGEYKNYSISGSVGLALYPQDGNSYFDLYQNADKALYQAKILGKNRYVIYSPALNIGTMRNITKIDNADRIAGSYFDYDLISIVFDILYESNGDDASINEVLKLICLKYNADRSYIFESLDNCKTYDNTFEWCKENITSEKDNLQGLAIELFVDFIEKAHNDIIYTNNLRETLQYDSAFEIMANQGILSFVHAQVKKDGIMTFFIGMDDCTKTRVWSEKEINSLQYIGKLISIILQGRHLDEKVRLLDAYNKNSTHILDCTDDVIYISDKDTYELLYLNLAAIRLVGSPPEEVWRNKKCYEILQGLDAPCEFCTNHLLIEDKFYEWTYLNPMLGKTFLLKDKLIQFDGRLARLEIATDISKATLLEKELQEKLDDEVFLSRCVELLHSGKEPASSIYKLLERVAKYYKAERSYIFELSECEQFISNTFEWCDAVATSYKDELQMLPVSELGLLFSNCKDRVAFSLIKEELCISSHSKEFKLMDNQNLNCIMVSPIISDDKKVTGFVGIDNPLHNTEKRFIMQSVAKFIANFLDVTELILKLNKLSYFDTLTGVKNRQSFNDEIQMLNHKHIDSLGIIYIDINGLGAINDAKGVLFGDEIIKILTGILVDVFKDNVFRVGGDEFVVLSENTQEHVFEKEIDTLKKQLSREGDFTATIGYTWNQNYISASDGERSYIGSEKYNRILLENLEMEIKNGKYVVCLQPQLDLATNKVTSAEALVRRVGAGGAYQPPIAFIPFYEKEGIISKIDIFVFETVCKYLKAWGDSKGEQIESVAVNCSRMTISDDGIVEIFSNLCDKYGVEKSKIVIEITETTNAISENVLSTIIGNFKEAGFSVSLDDFGCGYSNLTSFVISDFDEVKIDMKLINNIHQNEKSKALTEVVLVLCQKLKGLVSVAEGVECVEQYEILKQMGCTKGQGYYFDRPITFKEFTEKYIAL